jgi:hypothetical protein
LAISLFSSLSSLYTVYKYGSTTRRRVKEKEKEEEEEEKIFRWKRRISERERDLPGRVERRREKKETV